MSLFFHVTPTNRKPRGMACWQEAKRAGFFACSEKFGTHSAHTILSKKNPQLFKAGCLARVLDHGFKSGLQELDVDIDGVVMKIYCVAIFRHWQYNVKVSKSLWSLLILSGLSLSSML